MSHHEHNPMKGHHRPAFDGRRRRIRFRIRPRYDDRFGASVPYNPWVRELVREHRDAPITPLARMMWWLAGAAIVVGGMLLIILWMR